MNNKRIEQQKRVGQQYRTSAQLIAALRPAPADVVTPISPALDAAIREQVARRAPAANARLLRNLTRMGFTL